MNIIQKINSTLGAIANCEKNENSEWLERHEETIESIMKNAPYGSGFDSGTLLNKELFVYDKKIVFTTGFHHMNDAGYYTGWTHHIITITPCFSSINIRITGKDVNGIKDYIHEIFHTWLTQEWK